jgi:hypothetical protein
MLILIEMNAIHSAGGCDTARIKEMAAERHDRLIGFREPQTSSFGADEFHGDRTVRFFDWRRTQDQVRVSTTIVPSDRRRGMVELASQSQRRPI